MTSELEHLLDCLMEECAEVQVRASKAIRFGMTEIQPGQPLTNAQRIADELNDLRAVVEMLETNFGLPFSDDRARKDAKIAKVLLFMEYAEDCGTLDRSLLTQTQASARGSR